jgi:hypothetical protein
LEGGGNFNGWSLAGGLPIIGGGCGKRIEGPWSLSLASQVQFEQLLPSQALYHVVCLAIGPKAMGTVGPRQEHLKL